MDGMAKKGMRSLPPPEDGTLSCIGDTTPQPKRGKHHPWEHVTRQRMSSPHVFGVGLGVLVASWSGCRMPLAMAPIAPERKGQQNILFRQ
jgi:hypothetical protein